MTNEAVSHNQIWVDGVELLNVISGDVSAAEEEVRKVIERGGGWFMFQFEGGHYTLHVNASTSVVVSYVD